MCNKYLAIPIYNLKLVSKNLTNVIMTMVSYYNPNEICKCLICNTYKMDVSVFYDKCSNKFVSIFLIVW